MIVDNLGVKFKPSAYGYTDKDGVSHTISEWEFYARISPEWAQEALDVGWCPRCNTRLAEQLNRTFRCTGLVSHVYQPCPNGSHPLWVPLGMYMGWVESRP